MQYAFSSYSPLVRRFLLGVLLDALGNGLTLSILVIYLHQVRGLSLFAASAILSWMAFIGLIVSPIVGTMVDKIGPKKVLLFGITLSIIGTLGWILAESLLSALLVAASVSVATAATWPPQTTMMARMVAEEERQRLFGLQFMMMNLGLGLGGLFSATIVDVKHPVSFHYLFILDAISFAVYFLFIASMRGIGGRITEELHEDNVNDGYREVLADRLFIRLSLIGVLMLTCGYASLDAGLPVLLSSVAGLSVKVLGPIWAVNTGVIVLAQIFVLNRIEGRSRTRLLGLVGMLWSSCWLLMWIGISLPAAWTFILAAVGIGIFAIGETIWSPIGPALANEMAPEHLRGRYSAVSSLVWVVSQMIGPMISGVMLGAGWAGIWLGALVFGSLFAGFLGLRLGRRLTPKQDGRLNLHIECAGK